MSKLKFQLVTPERTVLNQELDSLTCSTKMGQITILPGHIPLVADLVVGEIVARNGSDTHYIHASGGFVEVRGNNEIIILADSAEHDYEIDEAQAKEAAERAKKILAEKQLSSEEYAKVAASLENSLSRLNVVRKRAHSRKAPITGEGILKD